MLFLLDRRGGLHQLKYQPGDSAARALIQNGIPPTSVLVYRDEDNVPVGDHATLAADDLYTARLIEGYDIAGILDLYRDELLESAHAPADAALLERRLAVAPTGALDMERHHLDHVAAACRVGQTVHDTIERFSLLEDHASVVLGLSGGVDSGSLLMLLADYRDRISPHPLTITAATFQDFDSTSSDTFDFARRLAERHGVEHQVLQADLAERVFSLTRPISQILMLLMESDDAHLAMYVDHHTTRRVLEVFADQIATRTIALGLHTTDLLAGLVNSWSTGHAAGPVPDRPVGDYRYIFPLAFVPKRELHLYYTDKTGHIPKQTTPNQWEFSPSDRNFHYYLADQLQWLWPGIHHWMFTAQQSGQRQPERFDTCENCGGAARELQGAPVWSGLCDVCQILNRHGWLQ